MCFNEFITTKIGVYFFVIICKSIGVSVFFVTCGVYLTVIMVIIFF